MLVAVLLLLVVVVVFLVGERSGLRLRKGERLLVLVLVALFLVRSDLNAADGDGDWLQTLAALE